MMCRFAINKKCVFDQMYYTSFLNQETMPLKNLQKRSSPRPRRTQACQGVPRRATAGFGLGVGVEGRGKIEPRSGQFFGGVIRRNTTLHWSGAVARGSVAFFRLSVCSYTLTVLGLWL
jgi:hypothetical protein